MNYGTNTAKFKSGFGVDGSQLNPKKGVTAATVSNKTGERTDLGASQRINKSALPSTHKASKRTHQTRPVNDDGNNAS
jgi:hypothetical protein